jgi:hypothetical protein
MFVRCMRRVLARNKSARAKVGANKSPSIRANLRAVFFCDQVRLSVCAVGKVRVDIALSLTS